MTLKSSEDFTTNVILGLVPRIHETASSIDGSRNKSQLLGLHPGEQAAGHTYIGVTNDILGRVEKHRLGEGSIFTAKYRVSTLVHFETFGDIDLAIQREKTLKAYLRAWKINLIERQNPRWLDLYPELKNRFG